MGIHADKTIIDHIHRQFSADGIGYHRSFSTKIYLGNFDVTGTDIDTDNTLRYIFKKFSNYFFKIHEYTYFPKVQLLRHKKGNQKYT